VQFVAGFVLGIVIVPIVLLSWTLIRMTNEDTLPLHRERRQMMFHKEE